MMGIQSMTAAHHSADRLSPALSIRFSSRHASVPSLQRAQHLHWFSMRYQLDIEDLRATDSEITQSLLTKRCLMRMNHGRSEQASEARRLPERSQR